MSAVDELEKDHLKRAVDELEKDHLRRILLDTALLLQFIQTFGYLGLRQAIEDIIKRLDEGADE